MINIILFSKNRAMQLELFIRSFNKYVKNHNDYIINILYTFTDDNFKKGYDKLINMKHTNVNYIKEKSFRIDLINLIMINNKYTVFFVDDIIFKNHIDFYDDQMNIFKKDKNILCRSLRLHPNLTYCYAMGIDIKNQPHFYDNNIFYWKNQQGDYGYPMSVDGHIFRTDDILPIIKKIPFNNPNSFEGYMVINSLKLPKMICYVNSIVVNNPCNIVQTNNPNFHGNEDINDLNNNFLNGYIISLDNIDGLKNISCHQEIKIILEKCY